MRPQSVYHPLVPRSCGRKLFIVRLCLVHAAANCLSSACAPLMRSQTVYHPLVPRSCGRKQLISSPLTKFSTIPLKKCCIKNSTHVIINLVQFTHDYHGPLVKRLRHRPFTAVTRVRVPYGSSNRSELLTSVLIPIWTVGRAAEGARLERVYTATPYRGFESLTVRYYPLKPDGFKGFFFYVPV